MDLSPNGDQGSIFRLPRFLYPLLLRPEFAALTFPVRNRHGKGREPSSAVHKAGAFLHVRSCAQVSNDLERNESTANK